MGRTIEAVYDGTVFRPMEPVTLEPNTRVQILVEAEEATREVVPSFLDIARSLNLDGPSDWSVNLERYLYGDGEEDEDWGVSGRLLRYRSFCPERFVSLTGYFARR